MNPALSLAAARIVLGTVAVTKPAEGTRIFRLDSSANPQLPFMTRLFASREIALGAATLLANGPAQRQLVAVGVAVDVVDALAAYVAGSDRSVSRPTALMLGAPAVLATVAGVQGFREL